jgi:hypothetical protein
MIAKLREGWSFLLTKLNTLGSILLAYALSNPAIVAELLPMLPAHFRAYAPVAALLWWGLVQFAKASAIRKAMPPPSKATQIAVQKVAASAQETADEISEDAKPPA